ncbi:Conserved_hypothetical protein [Hexamita inflata]|uniref:Uncharacterized protein n=1 Tax=Hexamita inflata TaxID=28002 RepID=A0AA86UBY6_9EUKA|nr:Conserved hypothetical protein [Hexamita inflata]
MYQDGQVKIIQKIFADNVVPNRGVVFYNRVNDFSFGQQAVVYYLDLSDNISLQSIPVFSRAASQNPGNYYLCVLPSADLSARDQRAIRPLLSFNIVFDQSQALFRASRLTQIPSLLIISNQNHKQREVHPCSASLHSVLYSLPSANKTNTGNPLLNILVHVQETPFLKNEGMKQRAVQTMRRIRNAYSDVLMSERNVDSQLELPQMNSKTTAVRGGRVRTKMIWQGSDQKSQVQEKQGEKLQYQNIKTRKGWRQIDENFAVQ